jgi:hypothetical protein
MNNKYTFSDNDYLSGDGMMTSIWGPPLWHVLHTISFNYPNNPTKEQKKNYYNFYNNLKNILPCKYCRDNLNDNLKKLPLTRHEFKNRLTLSMWVYNLHEIVNLLLNKKSGLTYNEVRERYEHFRSRCLEDPNKIIKENGCIEPLYGIKSKCVLNIVPKTSNIASFEIDPKCIIKKISKKASKKISKKGSKKK